MKRRQLFDFRRIVPAGSALEVARQPFLAAPPSRTRSNPMSDPIEPRPQPVWLLQSASLLDQDHERRLEGVIHIIGVTEHLPANSKDHRPKSDDNRLEGDRITPLDEPRKNLPFGEPRDRPWVDEPF